MSLVHSARLNGHDLYALLHEHPRTPVCTTSTPGQGVTAAALDLMPGQLSLPGLDEPAPPFRPDHISDPAGKLLGYTLFLAIVPEPDHAQRIAHAADGLCHRQQLLGHRLPPARLHITLHAIAGFGSTLPQSVIDAAKAAAASVSCPPLPLVFDRALSFSHNDAFVLRCDKKSDAAVARLRQSLRAALKRVGLDPQPSGTPHMTLLYDTRHIPEHLITPISWVATRFALIVSHVGLTHHQWLAEWRLTG